MTNDKLIQDLIYSGYLKHPKIIKAFKNINRADFVPEELKSLAYLDEALLIGYGQTISQPLVVAFMLEILELKKGDKILEIGAGSGWQTALIANIIGERGKIYSIERIPELYDFAKNNISKYNFLEKGIVKLILGDGSKGYKEESPYDKIIAAASADEIPEAWLAQLKINGRVVAPIKNSIFAFGKTSKNKFRKKEYFGFSFVPLIRE